MSTTDHKRTDKHKVIHELILNRFALSSIQKLEELQRKYSDDPQLQIECSVWIATVYEENGRRAEALSIYEEVIRQPDLLGGLLASVLPTVLKMWTEAGRLEEAVALFKLLIHHNSLHFMSRLSVLAWYARNTDRSSREIEPFRPTVSAITNALGVPVMFADTRACILHLDEVEQAANRQHMKYQLSLHGKTKDERIALTREYLNSDLIPFYKNLAEDVLQRIENSAKLVTIDTLISSASGFCGGTCERHQPNKITEKLSRPLSLCAGVRVSLGEGAVIKEEMKMQ